MPEISSLYNERVKKVVKLREEKRLRQQEGLMFVEGCYELELALSSGMRPREIFVCEELISRTPLGLVDLPLVTVSRSVFEKMSYRDHPDGWLAIVPIPHRSLDNIQLAPVPILVIAESVEKPGNLGAILRSADAVGANGVIVCEPRVDLFHPNVIRASRGTVFSVPAVESTNNHALEYMRSKKISIVAATPHVDRLYTEINYSQPVCIVVGTEDIGLSRFWLDHADQLIKIPMYGKVNSLNVSNSLAIILYEAIRQRTK